MLSQQSWEIGLRTIKVQLFGDVDILTPSLISDMCMALAYLSAVQQTAVPGNTRWLEYDELRFHDWEQSWYVIFCAYEATCVRAHLVQGLDLRDRREELHDKARTLRQTGQGSR